VAFHFISTLDIHDSAGFEEYVPLAVAASTSVGGEILALEDSPIIHEGKLSAAA